MNQSMVSENNRYSKYLDQEEVEVEIVDRSQIVKAGGAVVGGDRLSDDMDDCIYSLNSDNDPRSARRPSIGDIKEEHEE